MKFAALLLITAPVWAQAPLKPVVAPSTEKPGVPRKTLTELESGIDYKLRVANDKDPFDLLGLTRGLYLPGYGAVLTTELSLVATPSINPFKEKFTPAEIARVHQRKAEHLPLLRNTMQGMWREAASALTSIPDSEQVVVAIRLLYQPWEDTSGLPGQILMKASRKAGLAGNIQTEEQ